MDIFPSVKYHEFKAALLYLLGKGYILYYILPDISVSPDLVIDASPEKKELLDILCYTQYYCYAQ